MKKVSLLSGIDDEESFEGEIAQRNSHGFRESRGIGTLKLETPAFGSAKEQEVQLGPPLGLPEVGIIKPKDRQDLFKSEPFP